MSDNPHIGELNPPNRLMLTPGPSSMDPRVYRALATPLIGHVDPWFRGCMDDVQVMLRQIFQTEADLTPDLAAKTLTVRLHHLTQAAHDQAIEKLLTDLNATLTVFPGTELVLVFKLGSS